MPDSVAAERRGRKGQGYRLPTKVPVRLGGSRRATRIDNILSLCHCPVMLERPESARAVTELILETFRLNGRLLEAGDRLTAPFGLTSARWQVLGAAASEGRPLGVAQIARRMGLTRQAVQRVVHDLERLGFVELAENPDHKRAKLVVLTPSCLETLAEVSEAQTLFAEQLASDSDPEVLTQMAAMLGKIRLRCETFTEQIDTGDKR